MSKKEKEKDYIFSNIETESIITCTKCGGVQGLFDLDAYEASEEFQSLGWRAMPNSGNIYCPNCASKFKPLEEFKS